MDRFEISDDMEGSALARLVSPVGLEQFFAEYWDRKLLYIAGPGARYSDLLDLKEFAKLLFELPVGHHSLKYFNSRFKDRDAAQDHFWRRKIGWIAPLSRQGIAELCEGGTIVFNAIHHYAPTLLDWHRKMYSELKTSFVTNAYCSAGANASAFNTHNDPQDVVIVQLAGSKEWLLWERVRNENPIATYDKQGVTAPEMPEDQTVTLTPGDVLYVPRGMWHWPRSLDDEVSLHLTLTLVAPTPLDVLHWLKSELSTVSEHRASLAVSDHQLRPPSQDPGLENFRIAILELLHDPDWTKKAVAKMITKSLASLAARRKD